jgi:hypothetical protein
MRPTADERLAEIRTGEWPPEERMAAAQQLLNEIENYWCPSCQGWRKTPECSVCDYATLPAMSMYAQLNTINELRGMLSIPPLEGFRMPEGKTGPNWIEITPAIWISLKRANTIRFKDGGEVEIDGEKFKPRRSVLETIERWLRRREIKSG